MKNLLIYLIFLLLVIPFGAWPFIFVSIVVFIFSYLENRNIKLLSVPIFAVLSIIWLPLALISIFVLIYLSREEVFVQVASLIAAIAVIFILFPIIYLFVKAPPLEFPEEMISTIITSMVAATTATIVGFLLSLPLGYLMARKDFNGKGFIEGVVDLPIVVPHTVAGIILLIVFGSSGIIGAPMGNLGIRFYYAFPGIVVAMLFVSVPFLINQIREGIEKVDERYELVAMNLGASRTGAFFKVVMPLIKRNILSGSINAWARAMSEFGAVIMIAFYPMIAPTYIYYLFTSYGLEATLPATSFLLLITLVIFITLRVLFERVEDNAKN